MIQPELFSTDVWNNCPISLIAVEAKFSTVSLNPAAEVLMGKIRADMLPREVTDKLMHYLWEKGLFSTTGPNTTEFQFYEVWVSIVVTFINDENYLLFLSDVSGDIKLRQQLSELRVLNNELNEIVEVSADGLVCVDQTGTILRLNKAYERILGIRGEKFVGKSARLLIEQGYLKDLVSPKVIAEGKPQTIVSRINNQDVIISGHPVFDEKGSVVRVIANIRDLTELNRLKDEVSKYYELADRYEAEIHHLRAKELESKIIGHSYNTRKMIAIAEQASKVDSTVLVYGETGTGKELLVKSIHRSSKQGEGPFIAVNCSTIPESLIESELFGYESGTFTGSNKKGKAGLFEAADGGTIFLDEIADMPLSMQVKLLRVIQERKVRRIGASKSRDINVRLIAASNERLEKCVEEGKFRADLFYRLNILNIEIPPLRDRKEDIPLLVNYFLSDFNDKFGRNKVMTKKDMNLLLNYEWPGNIRELRNVIERYVVLTDEIHLEKAIFSQTKKGNSEHQHPISCLKSYLKEKEIEIITETYTKCLSTRKTAEILNVSQSTIVRKLPKESVIK